MVKGMKGIDGELRSSELLESGTVTGQQGDLICRSTLIVDNVESRRMK